MTPYLAVVSARFRVLLQYRAAAFAGIVTQTFFGFVRLAILLAFFRAASGPQPMTPADLPAYIWLGQAMFQMVPWSLDREVAACIAKLSEVIDRALHALPGCEDAAIAVAGDRLRPVGGSGEVVAACESEWLLGERTPLYRAAYDRAFVERDGSKGAHNPAFTMRVLRAALAALGP